MDSPLASECGAENDWFVREPAPIERTPGDVVTRLSQIVSVVLAFTLAAVLGVPRAESAPAKPATRATKDNTRVDFVLPELPREQVDTKMPTMRGKTTKVTAKDDLQAALKNAQGGDTLILDAGATYGGSFILPKKAGDGWIIIKSSGETELPPPGTPRAGCLGHRHLRMAVQSPTP